MVNLTLLLFGLTLLYVSAIGRLEGYIKALFIQGLLLSLLMCFNFTGLKHWNFALIIVETIGFKTLVIPWFLQKVIHENEMVRETEPYITHFYSLLLTSLIFSFGFFVAYWAVKNAVDVRPLPFGIAISTIITGLFIILTRKKLITHTMGFMIMENGIFLLSLAKLQEMPMIVNLGILLDIFLAVLLLGIFINKIKDTFEELDIDRLKYLKD